MVTGIRWVPTKNWMSCRVKGVETASVPPVQYSPGWIRKKNVIKERLVIAWYQGKTPWATDSM